MYNNKFEKMQNLNFLSIPAMIWESWKVLKLGGFDHFFFLFNIHKKVKATSLSIANYITHSWIEQFEMLYKYSNKTPISMHIIFHCYKVGSHYLMLCDKAKKYTYTVHTHWELDVVIIMYGALTHWELDVVVIIWGIWFLNRLKERPGTRMALKV